MAITLTDAGTESVVYDQIFELDGEEDIETDNIVDGGEYHVRVVIDENRELSKTMAVPCKITTFYITIREPDSSSIGRSYCG